VGLYWLTQAAHAMQRMPHGTWDCVSLFVLAPVALRPACVWRSVRAHLYAHAPRARSALGMPACTLRWRAVISMRLWLARASCSPRQTQPSLLRVEVVAVRVILALSAGAAGLAPLARAPCVRRSAAGVGVTHRVVPALQSECSSMIEKGAHAPPALPALGAHARDPLGPLGQPASETHVPTVCSHVEGAWRGFARHACAGVTVVGKEILRGSTTMCWTGQGACLPPSSLRISFTCSDAPPLCVIGTCAARAMPRLSPYPWALALVNFTCGTFFRKRLLVDVPMLLCGSTASLPAERSFTF